MVTCTVSWAKSVRTLRIFTAVVADYVGLHGFVIEDFKRGMQELEVVRRKMWNDVLVVNYSEEIRHDEMQVRGKGTITDPWTSI